MFGYDKWERRRLGDVGSFTRGGGFQKSDYVEQGIPCIHYGQIHTKFGPFIFSHISEISSNLKCKTKFASKGDLIIAITSEDVEGSCKSTAWIGDYPVAIGGHAAIYRHSMNPLYVSFFFKSPDFGYAKKEYIHGSKVAEIRPDDIAKISIPIPPMELQEQFAGIVLQADKSKFDGFKSQFLEMTPSVKMVKISELTNLIRKNVTPEEGTIYSLYSFPAFDNDKKPETIDGKEIKSAKLQIQSNCILFNKLNVRLARVWNIGEIDSTNTICSSEFLPFVPKETISKDYLYFCLTSPSLTLAMSKASKGTSNSQKRISPKDIQEYEIPLPDVDVQAQIVKVGSQADKSKYYELN